MSYSIKPLPEGTGVYPFDGAFDPEQLDSRWQGLEKAEILDYCWSEEYPTRFYAAVRVGYNAEGLHVLMYAKENPIRAAETRYGGRQCEDSCLEFFLCPFPEDSDKYLNFELNPLGTAHVGAGEGRHGRKVYSEPVPEMEITAFHDLEFWAVSFLIPQSLFLREFGKAPSSGKKMKGNFYKCSGSELHEHYGCWHHVVAPHPDFHRPECFGEMTVE